MARTKIANFPIEYLQVMDENGEIDEHLMPQISQAMILKMLKTMLYSRKFDEKMLSLQRQGRIGTIPQGKGQEACSVGAVACMNLDDIIFPSYREWAALIWRGVPLKYVFMNFSGDERGNSADFNYRVFPFNIPIATHMPHAVGVALGMKLKKKNRVVACFLGDGTTSEGDFHESMNFAGVFKVPCVFICQNNQYAISTPTKKQTASETFAQKGIAYGMPCIRVDGNDVFAVYVAVQEAIARARRGEGPTFIEAYTYRLCDHTTSDDAKRYRSDEEFRA
ncbi:pyruvate dehydrogenase (acetyl-transferring) E1 component subunit alpha, partial [Candidatus Woesearchaeota archaeon]|nr:pyruvate dehydrogenase (acetyl-transferring) E1 component subunit alpha [Candidatus Woesearchaeota archaeon]